MPRLLDLNTMQLESFVDTKHNYAILSYTWCTGKNEREIVFEEWGPELAAELKASVENCAPETFQPDRGAAGRKLAGFCRKALDLGFEYGWIDTLCIDKRVCICRTSGLADLMS